MLLGRGVPDLGDANTVVTVSQMELAATTVPLGRHGKRVHLCLRAAATTTLNHVARSVNCFMENIVFVRDVLHNNNVHVCCESLVNDLFYFFCFPVVQRSCVV